MLERLPSSDFRIAVYYAHLGENDKALDSMERAYANRDLNFIFFIAEPTLFACCFHDPRYSKLESLLLGFSPRSRS